MIAIGTKVICNQSGSHKHIGQVADHESDRWGQWHIVAVDGGFQKVGHIGKDDMKGIGWKVASQEEIEFVNRCIAKYGEF